MFIRTKRLYLKPVCTNNIDAVAEILANPDINKWIENLKNKDKNYIKSTLEDYYQPEGLNYYAAIYKDEKVIGIVSLEQEQDNFYYIDIYLDPSAHRQGYATEVIMQGIYTYIQQHREIKKIAVRIATQNTASNSLADKLKTCAKELDIEVKICPIFIPFLTDNQKKYVYGITAFAFGVSAGLFCFFKYSSKGKIISGKIQDLVRSSKML